MIRRLVSDLSYNGRFIEAHKKADDPQTDGDKTTKRVEAFSLTSQDTKKAVFCTPCWSSSMTVGTRFVVRRTLG
jgi:hypothetical protein